MPSTACELLPRADETVIALTPANPNTIPKAWLRPGRARRSKAAIAVVKTGIAEAIASQLGGLKGNRNAIAETIENNVRRKILKEHLSDPAYYEKMSALLDEIIAARKARAIEYEEYLRRVAVLAKRVEEKQPGALDRYLTLLKSGGSDYPYELVKKAGVDLATPAPYQALVARMNSIMDEIEAILAKQKK